MGEVWGVELSFWNQKSIFLIRKQVLNESCVFRGRVVSQASLAEKC